MKNLSAVIIFMVGSVCPVCDLPGQSTNNQSAAGLLQSLPVKCFHQTGPDVGSLNPATPLKTGGYNPVELRVCADGSDATFIYILAPNDLCELGELSIRIKNDSLYNNPDIYGAFYPEKKKISGSELKWKYVHPVWLGEPDSIFRSRDDTIQVLYRNQVIREMSVRFMTTPVIMIHGLWGSPKSFAAMSDYLSLHYTTQDCHRQHLLHRLDYSQMNSHSYREIYRQLPENIGTIRRKLADAGISSGKVDILAHSMGGLIGRYYFQSSLFLHDVRKIISVNTPHAGTPAANFLKSDFEGAAVARTTLLMAMGGNVVDGAVEDLQVLPALNSLQTLYQSLERQQLPSHAVVTTDQLFFSDLSGLSKDEALIYEIAFARMPLAEKMSMLVSTPLFLWYLNQSATDFLNASFGEPNDYIVPSSSQEGGLLPGQITQLASVSHTSTLQNPDVQNQVVNLLKLNPENTMLFSQDGYDPPYLSFLMNQKSPATDPFVQDTGCNSLTIIPGVTECNAGDTLIIMLNNPGSVFYQRLWIRAGDDLLLYHDTTGNVMDVSFIVPSDLSGRLQIISMITDTNNHYCIDSLIVRVNNALPLDSILISPDYFYLPVCGLQYFNLTGVVSDTLRISVTADTTLFIYVSDTAVASFHFPNILRGRKPGAAWLHVGNGNDTLLVPIQVYNNNLFLIGDSVACTGAGGNEFHLYSAVEGRYYQLFRNDTALGQPMLCGNNVPSFGNFQEPGVYSVYETDTALGCVNRYSNKINLTLSVSPVVDLGPDTVLVFPDSVILDAGNPGCSYTWSTGSNIQTITAATAGTYWVEVNNAGRCPVSDTIRVTVSGPGHLIHGSVTYQNAGSTALNSSTVTLYLDGLASDQQLTDSLGNFYFTYPMSGNCCLEATSAKPWGGVNAIDALKILRHFVNLSPLGGLSLKAADVDSSGFINSIDALLCMNRFVNLINSFPGGDWTFESPCFQVHPGDNIILNIKGLCLGDVDGSYVPAYCVPWPSQPYAGSDSLNIPDTVFNLTAVNPVVGTGKWKKISGAGGVFGDTLQAQTTFTGIKGQIYYLTWSVTTICHTLVDTLVIGFAAPGPCEGKDTLVYGGQSYNLVEIGFQCWMKENLNLGTFINAGINQSNNGVIEKYCMNNNPSNCDIYGGLYQWDEMMNYSGMAGTQGICPSGWHIPAEQDWCVLLTFLDPTVNCSVFGLTGTDAGGKMKESGTDHWQSPNTGATNVSGFTALPAGRWNKSGSFSGMFVTAYLWSSTEYSGFGTYRTLSHNQAKVGKEFYLKGNGNSVRCIQNE